MVWLLLLLLLFCRYFVVADVWLWFVVAMFVVFFVLFVLLCLFRFAFVVAFCWCHCLAAAFSDCVE